MDSLLSNYASSDEEQDQIPKIQQSNPSLFNSLPQPKSQPNPNPNPKPKSSLFNSLPPPKPKTAENAKPKSLFSSVPAPKSSVSSNSKRVVQFKPPQMANASLNSLNDEDEEDDEGEKERQRKRARESVSKSAGFVLPAPRFSTSLGTLGSGSRKSMLETGLPASGISEVTETESNLNSNVKDSDQSFDYSTQNAGSETYANNDGYVDNSGSIPGNDNVRSEIGYDYNTSGNYTNPEYYNGGDVGSEAGNYSYANVEYTNDGNSYVEYPNNVQYGNSWSNPAPEGSDVISELRNPLKRGRRDVVPEIIEVKQDDLTKNRPREDQVKSTGIAFGPAYQPASSKGKPTKLHKRKHQISSLYFDMRQKESELAERRSRGYQTKAQTQGKYGW